MLNGTLANLTSFIRLANDAEVGAIAAGLLMLFIAWCLWWRLPKRQVARLPNWADPKERSDLNTKERGDLENSFRVTVGQAIAGVFVLLGVAVAYLQFQEQRQAAHNLLISNQVSKGFEDLGSPELMVRVGGIYALEGVMNNSPQYEQATLDGLSAFVREETKGNVIATPATDVQAALTVIGRRSDGAGVADLEGANLTGVTLWNSNFMGANLTRANVTHAKLFWVNLMSANLTGTNFTGAVLLGANLTGHAGLQFANLTGASLGDADLTDAIVENANLTHTDLQNAHLCGTVLEDDILTGATFGRANLTGAKLEKADLTGDDLPQANLTRTDLEDANLTRTDLVGADLTGANLMGANLNGAFLTNTTLQQSQLDKACGINVTLPPGLTIKPCK